MQIEVIIAGQVLNLLKPVPESAGMNVKIDGSLLNLVCRKTLRECAPQVGFVFGVKHYDRIDYGFSQQEMLIGGYKRRDN